MGVWEVLLGSMDLDGSILVGVECPLAPEWFDYTLLFGLFDCMIVRIRRFERVGDLVPFCCGFSVWYLLIMAWQGRLFFQIPMGRQTSFFPRQE